MRITCGKQVEEKLIPNLSTRYPLGYPAKAK